MSAHHHPIRGLPIRVYVCEGAPMPFRAFFGDGRSFPVYFDGPRREDAAAAAEAFRMDVIAKHEAAYAARASSIAKARGARQRKGKAA